MENFTDIQLITLYFNGNQKALDGLINRYAQHIYRFSLKILGNSEEARDATQETMIKMWKNLKKFDTNRNFKTWIFTIAHRTSIDFLRKRKDLNFSSLEDTDTDTNPIDSIIDENAIADEIFAQNENIEIVKNALSKISIENRIIVLLHNGEEMTFDEISEILNKPLNTLKSRYRRTLIELKELILNENAPNL